MAHNRTSMQHIISEIKQSDRVIEDSERVMQKNADETITNIRALIFLDIPENEKIEHLQAIFQGATTKRFVTEKIYYDFCVAAIEKGAENVFVFFVERQKKLVNYEPRNGWTLLHVAAYYKRSSMMVYLLQQGASINKRSAMVGGLSCVHIAIGRGDVDTVKLLGDMFKLDFNNYLAEETIGFGPRMCSAPLDIGVGHLPPKELQLNILIFRS